MITDKSQINEVPYLYDQSGRIWMKGDKVFRIIEDENHIKNYKELLNSDIIEELFSIGLVRTKIVEESILEGIMILEHKKIPFILHSCEYTNRMFWQAAYMFIEMNLKLWEKGFLTQDSHAWNMSFDGTKPVFYDFGSIIKGNHVSEAWFNEFFNYFIVPIWLGKFSYKTLKFSKEYRRENQSGFGIKIFASYKLRRIFFRKVKSIFKINNDPEEIFKELLKWLSKHEPNSVNPEYWSDYYKSHNADFTKPITIKQKFVFEILNKEKPEKVNDLASNKGYYAFMAANLGAAVVAFDYEEEIVDSFLVKEDLNKKITPVHMDFKKPTAAFGVSLFWQDSFKRFQADIVLVLGLIHHVCITQNVPVYLFCESCKKYATHGIILEFVDPTDKHVRSWNKLIPKDYNIDSIIKYMGNKFSNYTISKEESDGLNRTFLYFYK